MDLFLIHGLLLFWSSVLAARRLVTGFPDRVLAAWVLAWGNLVVTSLLLSAIGRLGTPSWFLGSSFVLAIATCLLAVSSRSVDPVPPPTAPARLWPIALFLLTLLPAALALGRIAWMYQPNADAALTHELPRAYYYLGQGSLAHFDASDSRQVFGPFNGSIPQLFGLIYGPPLPCLNAWNVLAWVVTGFAVHRTCRLGGLGFGSALVATWFALVSAPVLIQGATSSADLPAGVALLAGLVFSLRYGQANLTRDGLLAGLAFGLAFGSTSPFVLLLLPLLLLPWLTDGTWRWQNPGHWLRSKRAWLVPVIPALVLGTPYLIINLVESGRLLAWNPPGLHWADYAAAFWSIVAGLRQLMPSLDSAPDGNTAWFGWTGLLVVLAAGTCLGLRRRVSGFVVGLAWAGLGWLGALVVLQPAAFTRPAALLPALLLLTPCLAAALDLRRDFTPRLKLATTVLLLIAFAGAAGEAAASLLFNPSRPLAALLDRKLYTPGLPSLPLLVGHRLAGQSWINVDSDAADAPILPFLVLGPNQRITSQSRTLASAYNLISRAASSRDRAYGHRDLQPAYVIVPVPTKVTGGVEFLGTIGIGAGARDYFGLEPRSNSVPLPSNRCLLVTIRRLDEKSANARIAVAGLDPRDGLRLDVAQEADDGTTTQLTSFPADGATDVALAEPFYLLHFKAIQTGDGAVAGAAALVYRIPAPVAPPPNAVIRSSRTGSIFVTDLVLTMPPYAVQSEGLLPVEGPFPQWNLPYIRWATAPVMRLRLPVTKGLAHLQLSFSVRLQVRERGVLEIWLNGERVQTYRYEGRDLWFDQDLELEPRKGENIIEFRDASRKGRPDWLGYLERNPDVKAYVLGQHIPPEQGAREHYEAAGKREGRPLPLIPTEEPDLPPENYYFMFRNLRLEGFQQP